MALTSPREQDDLLNSATHYARRTRRGRARPALDDVIDTLYHVLAVTAPGDSTHNAADVFLITALQLRGEQSSDRADLDRAIARLCWAVQERIAPAYLDQARRMLIAARHQIAGDPPLGGGQPVSGEEFLQPISQW